MYPESKAASLAKLNHFFILIDIFKKHNIGFIALKGPVLSYQIYNDATYRTIGDFDFLLDPSLIDYAVEILKKNGYKPLHWPESQKSVNKKKKYRNQILMEQTDNGTLVELHWRLFGISSLSDKRTKELVKNNLIELELYGRKVVTLNQEMNLLFLIIHGGHHNWFRLKWLEDVHQITKKRLYNPEKFVEFAMVMKAKRMVNLCNALLDFVYHNGVKLPSMGKASEVAVNFSKSRISAKLERPFESVSELFWYTVILWRSFPGYGYKFRVLKFILYSFLDENDEKPLMVSLINLFVQPLRLLKKRYRLQKTKRNRQKKE